MAQVGVVLPTRDRPAQLGRAVAARVLLEPEGPPGSYRFSHALIRETLYDELSTARRIRLHHRIGETLEALHADRPGPALSQLAYHFCEGAPAGDPERAIACAVRAAERAAELVAYEEAAATYERALQVLELRDPVDPIRQCELLVACAEAHKAAGAMDRAETTARRAAEIARRERRADLLAGAALAFSWNNPETEETEGQHLLEEALERAGEGEPALRARLLTQLAGNLGAQPAGRRRGESLIQEAIALARILTYTVTYLMSKADWQDILLVPIYAAAQLSEQPSDDTVWLVTEFAYTHVIELATAISFTLVEEILGREPWSPTEQRLVRDFITSCVDGGNPLPPEFLYLPLLLGGIAIAQEITFEGEDTAESMRLLAKAKAERGDLFEAEDLSLLNDAFDRLVAKQARGRRA